MNTQPCTPPSQELLADRFGHSFTDRALLLQALRHRSWCAEHPGAESNERLEFLGDAVLGLIVTTHLFRTYPELPEGELAKVRASVVDAATLAEVASELRFGEAMFLGKGEDHSGGRDKASILADGVEALLGAVYLDGGWEPSESIVMQLLGDRMALAAQGPGGQDYKTRLQELAARRFEKLPHYAIDEQGPDHAKEFDATVHIDGEFYGQGHGRSKKQAEQSAARAAWDVLTSSKSASTEQPLSTATAATNRWTLDQPDEMTNSENNDA